MKKYLFLPFCLLAIMACLGSCHNDAYVKPSLANITFAIDTSLLNGTWTVQSSQEGLIYDGVLSDNKPCPNMFSNVAINSKTGTAVFANSQELGSGLLTYTLSLVKSNTYLTFSADPIGRPANQPIHIIDLTASSMTWIAPDSLVATTNGHTMQQAVTVTFTR